MTAPDRPRNPRCSSTSETTLNVQWEQSTEPDVVGYRVQFHNADSSQSGVVEVPGASVTYGEVSNLTASELYSITVRAVDFSDNVSAGSPEIPCRTVPIVDTTAPVVQIEHPTAGTEHTTSQSAVAVTGNVQDTGGNLSRVRVRNETLGAEKWDYSVSGSAADFHVEDIGLGPGDNQLKVTGYDTAGNSADSFLLVHQAGEVQGAVIIVAGRNETNNLQVNISNTANRAYRIFQGAGYSDDMIYYLSPQPEDPDGDGVYDDVDATATAANLHSALQTWTSGRVGPGQPLFLYFMDHGGIEFFCADGCYASGHVDVADLDAWLSAVETATGVDEVNILIEACHSGSFIDNIASQMLGESSAYRTYLPLLFNGTAADTPYLLAVRQTLSKPGRVVISSTGRTNNAYASAQGAYFSDAFFTCAAASGDLKSCFDAGQQAVSLTGRNQSPWLDDNGDAVANASDGLVAATRYMARLFGALGPEITEATVTRQGTLTAHVERGDEPITLVWADVFAPSFQEPISTTLELGAPRVRLDPVPDEEGVYQGSYSGGFTESGAYTLVLYAQDRSEANSRPKVVTLAGSHIYLPIVVR